MTPDDHQVGTLAEHVAGAMPRGAASHDLNAFYAELAEVAEHFGTAVLERRRILVDHASRLRRAGPYDEATEKPVFLPPQTVDLASEDRVISLPPTLADAVAFLHPSVVLLESGRRARTEIGEILRRGDLAKPYDTEQVARSLAAASKRARSDQKRWEVLNFLVDLYQAAPRVRAVFKGLDVPVPVEHGWIDGSSAIMGPGWSSVSDLLSDCLRADDTAELTELGARRVLPPAAWPSPPDDIDSARDFLRAVGVLEGLHPVALDQRPLQADGRYWEPSWVTSQMDLDERSRSWWLARLDAPSTPAHGWTAYRQAGSVWVLPGQATASSLAPRARLLLAELIIASVPQWSPEVWDFRFQRFQSHHRSKPDTQRWDSPVAAFLAESERLPISEPGRRDILEFVPLREAWNFDDDLGQAPNYMSLVVQPVRRQLRQHPATLERLRELGLDTWNDPTTGRLRLHQLAALLEDGAPRESDVDAIKKALRRAWHDTLEPRDDLDAPMVVQVGHVLRVAATDEVAYLPQEPPGYVQRLLETLERPVLVIDADDGVELLTQLPSEPHPPLRSVSTVDVDVRLDGRSAAQVPVEDLASLPPWVTDWVLLAAELTRNAMIRLGPAAIERLITEVRRTRVAFGRSVSMTIDGEPALLPAHLSRCVPMREGDDRTLIIEAASNDLTWDVLVNASDAMAELVGRSALATDLRLAATELKSALGHAWRAPTPEEWAVAYRESPVRVQEVLAAARSTVARIQDLVTPFVVVFAGEETARQLLDTEPDSTDSLRSMLSTTMSDETTERLLKAAEDALDVTAMRRALDVSFGDLNRALRQLGAPYEPRHDVTEHRRVYEWFLAQNLDRITEALRAGFLPTFDAGRPLDDYVELRVGPDLQPTEEELDEYESPPPEVVSQRVDEWLRENGCPTLGTRPEGIPSVTDVRLSNRALADSMATEVQSAVGAWERAHLGGSIDTQPLAELAGLLERTGWADFRLLSRDAVLRILQQRGLWPASMPLTLDMTVLGLQPAEVASHAQEASAYTPTRQSVVSVGDEDIDAADLLAVRNAVMATVDESLLSSSTRPTRLSTLTSTSDRQRDDRRQPPAPMTTPRASRQTDAQRTAIGFAGELLAYHWVRRQYPEANEQSWVSENRSIMFDGPGDDSLGYDLIVHRRNQTLRFEVKATTTDNLEFEMSDKEIYVAQRATRRQPYRILFLRRVLEPSARQLLVLPNPFDADSSNRFRMTGRGLRLTFLPVSI